ncbi:polysaccharide deacetylase family protein [Azospirillum sp. SYSU D00513]|uniref:polysaccharide deacetylase family protein n=1 Tax=Azospirillum sp. SYSU D00513 TaxID=2812561 RepID=UPI001A9775EC|nr:polysaccharide deacetylase family protein [Azospirillum sp. SYSU D00513]
MLRRAAALLAWTAALFAGAAPHGARALGAESAVVFAYGRFGEDEAPNVSIRLDQFEAHLEELTDGGYTVMPLPAILEALRAGRPLPEGAVALTIDEASRSAYREAWPRLRAAGLPVTLFVAPDPVDRGSPSHMSWDEIRRMASDRGVTIGGLGASGLSLAQRPEAEVRAELRRMEERILAELGRRPALLAYPQGEQSLALHEIVEERMESGAFGGALGQQSGVLHRAADRRSLPRFMMNEAFGSVERFRLAAGALPLPVSELAPEDPLLSVNPPALGFTVSEEVGDLSRLACFASGQGRASLERLGERRIEVRLRDPFPPGRARVNCTLPAADGHWRWFGVQFVIPE